ncbi:MAG: hypothetical protein R6T83_07305 [Salinibacter sp.]
MWKLRSEASACFLRVVVAIVLAGGGFAIAGCDSGGTRQASQYQTLAKGAWEVGEFRVEGTDLTSQLEQRYTAPVLFEFRGGEDEARTFHLLAPRTDDTLRVRGSVSLSEPNGLTMVGGFGRPVSWTLNFDRPDELSTSVRFRLPRTQAAGSEALLSTLLPGQGWGDAQRVRLDLLFRGEATGSTIHTSNFSQDG